MTEPYMPPERWPWRTRAAVWVLAALVGWIPLLAVPAVLFLLAEGVR
ncbi:MAG: hypothetical protein ACYDD1_05490 [Caulobacteraceae bacterium]